MPAGAPRTVSFSKEEMINLGEEMVLWVMENNPLHLSEWYTIEKMFTYKQWKTFSDREEFVPYYEMALKWIGKQYLDKDSRVRNGISERWLRTYFADLREQEDADLKNKLELEAKAKSSSENQGNQSPIHELLSRDLIIAKLRGEIEELRIERSKPKTESELSSSTKTP